MSMTNVKNALPTALLVLGTQKVVASSQGVPVPTEVQMEGALVAGASAVVVDSTLRGQNQIIRAVAVGGLLAGAMYAWKGDAMVMVWLPTGAIAYLASDWATSSMRM
jgi:hypothetical protein